MNETEISAIRLRDQVMRSVDTIGRYAFFDVDGTLISIKSMFAFRAYCLGRLRMYRGLTGYVRYWLHDMEHRLLSFAGASREVLNRRYYENYRGAERREVLRLVRRWYGEAKERDGLFVAGTLDVLRDHKRRGVKTVVVSGSFCDLLRPLLEDLEIDYCLATELEAIDGRYTGRIIPPQMIGAGKAQAIKTFVGRRGIDPSSCYAYGDDESDIPMLEIVGSPSVISSNQKLMRFANTRGWGVVHVD